jgi:hypothetical protein
VPRNSEWHGAAAKIVPDDFVPAATLALSEKRPQAGFSH